MIMPRASFLSVLAFVAAVAGGSYFLETLATRLGVAVAHADTVPVDAAALPVPDAAVVAAGSGSGSAVTQVGSASQTTVSTTTTITNADQLHDVLSDPLGALSDVKTLWAAKKALGVLALLILATRVVARIPGAIGTWFATGVRSTVISGAAAIAVAAFDALTTGASWMAIVIAALGAVLALLAPTPAPATTASTKAA